MKAMSALAILCACSLSVHAHDEIPKGKLGHPLGTYLTIEGVRFGVDKIGKVGKIDTHTLLVDTINGKKLDRPTTISIETSGSLPMRERCVFRGYESGRMVGVPFEVARAENLPLPQVAWQFHRYFIITSVVQPAGLDRSLNGYTGGGRREGVPHTTSRRPYHILRTRTRPCSNPIQASPSG